MFLKHSVPHMDGALYYNKGHNSDNSFLELHQKLIR